MPIREGTSRPLVSSSCTISSTAFEGNQADGTFLTSFGQTVHQLRRSNTCGAVAFDHAEIGALNLFVSGKAICALQGKPGGGECWSVTRLAGIDDLVISESALGTTHIVFATFTTHHTLWRQCASARIAINFFRDNLRCSEASFALRCSDQTHAAFRILLGTSHHMCRSLVTPLHRRRRIRFASSHARCRNVIAIHGKIVEENIVTRGCGHHQVHRERDLSRAHRPNMKVVHFVYLGQTGEKTLHRVRIDSARHRIHREIHRLAQQPPRSDDDHHPDRETHRRIEPMPARRADRQASQHHA